MLLKMGNIDWSMVEDVAMIIAVLVIPVGLGVWWLYDTDAYDRFTERFGVQPSMLGLMCFWLFFAVDGFQQHTWKAFAGGLLYIGLTILMIWQLVRNNRSFKAP